MSTSGEAGGLSAHEENVLRHLTGRLYISRDINSEFDQARTFGQRLADRIAAFGGSWPFIILFGSILFLWIFVNSYVLARRGEAFDPYPYILLNLFLSMVAAVQAPIIMMSQNRQAARDRRAAAHDYEVNLKAELEIMALHQKLDALREQQWKELIEIQQEQTRLLMEVLKQRERSETKS